MANNPRNPGKPIYIGKPKPRPKPGEKVMKPLPVKPGAGNGKKMPLPIKPGRDTKDIKPGDRGQKIPAKPGQDRQKKLKTLEAQMKKAKAKKK
jgi:hypothetical protein